MTATVHAIVGAALINKFPTPLTFPVIFASHFILDAIPHWDFGTNWKGRSKFLTGFLAIFETVLGITVTYFLYSGKVEVLLLITSIVISELPDWLEAPWYIFFAQNNDQTLEVNVGFWKKLAYTISKIEAKFHTRAQLPWGLLTQIASVVVLLFLLK